MKPFQPRDILIALIIVATLGVAVAGYFAQGYEANVAHQSDLRTINILSTNNDALRAQVKSLGQTPVAPPASSVVPTGQAGQNGANGANGQNASDTQVFNAVRLYCDLRVDCAGPTGLQGPAGTAGQNGTNGADGAPGAAGPAGQAGQDGTAGQPPVSWVYMDDLGVSHTCTRTDPFDPASPQYTCTTTPPAP